MATKIIAGDPGSPTYGYMILESGRTGTIATICHMSACQPRYATPRTRRRTLGPEVAGVARDLGLPLLPWQRQVLSAALEQHRGRPAYRDVTISVPRQSGKSSLLLALAT